MKSHFGITIPTKPYLSKYLQALYGSPIVFTTRTYFGTSLLGYLNTRLYTQHESLTFQKFNTFSCNLQVMLPNYWVNERKYMIYLTQTNIIYLNKHFEEKFEEDLYRFCLLQTSKGMQRQKTIELFCNLHNIELDQDISLDALIKKEFRQRKQVEKLSLHYHLKMKNALSEKGIAANV